MRKLRTYTLPITLAAGALLLALARPASQPASEYRVVRYAGVDLAQDAKKQDAQVAELQNQLNGYAAEGWELAFVQGGFAILRR